MTVVLEECFPDWSREKLERIARQRAIELDLDYGRTVSDHESVDRLLVNMLRHELTNYDDDQNQEVDRLACEVIKARCPWLGHECDRQVGHRRFTELRDGGFFEMAEQWAMEERQRREERSRASSVIISTLIVGDEVCARIGGHERVGTIAWLERRRVEVAYVIKSDEARTRRLFAVDMRRKVTAVNIVNSDL
jgi:hypothetical protein